MQFAFTNSVIANINYDAITHTHTPILRSRECHSPHQRPIRHARRTCLSPFVGDGIQLYMNSYRLNWFSGVCGGVELCAGLITEPRIHHLSFTDFTCTACTFVPSTLWNSWHKLMRELQFWVVNQIHVSGRREFHSKNLGLKKKNCCWTCEAIYLSIRLFVSTCAPLQWNPPINFIILILR